MFSTFPVISSSSKKTLPVEGDSNPAIIERRVDLPQPLGPTILTKSP